MIASRAGELPLIEYAADSYSQNGEDGVLRRIFEVIGTSSERCCEFGAWDGIHFSNTRALILEGWSGVFIEGDGERATRLRETYHDLPRVATVSAFVDDGESCLRRVLEREGLDSDFDLVSIDIDGLDYEVFAALGIEARVVCVEAGVLLNPDQMVPVPRELAAQNVGQPLARFRALGERLGYKLVCFTGNAIFVRRDLPGAEALNTLSPATGYVQHLSRLRYTDRQWLYRANLGLGPPPYLPLHNPYLSLGGLGLPAADAVHMARARRWMGRARRASLLERLAGSGRSGVAGARAS
jgi:hypothetical protein